MTEVTAKYKLFLAVGMVVTGTLNTISTKERFQFDVRSSHWLKMGSGPVEKCLSSWEPNYLLGNIGRLNSGIRNRRNFFL